MGAVVCGVVECLLICVSCPEKKWGVGDLESRVFVVVAASCLRGCDFAHGKKRDEGMTELYAIQFVI